MNEDRPLFEIRSALRDRKEHLWDLLTRFANLRDAHGVRDMAVEICGIETVLRELQ